MILLAYIISTTSIILAQKTIYIRPTVGMKINNSQPVVGGGNKSPLDLVSNEYYAFYNYGWHLNPFIVNFGLNAGIHLNKKSAIELSMASDNASVKNAIVYNSRNYVSDLNSESFLRYTVEYQRTFFENESTSVRGKAGLGFFSVGKSKSEIVNRNPVEPNYSLNIEENFNTYKRIAPILTVGAGLDLKNKKGNPFCSLDFSFSYNRNRIMYSSAYDVNVTVQNQEVANFKHSLLSTGTGFNLQLSFPIKVYTLRKKSDK